MKIRKVLLENFLSYRDGQFNLSSNPDSTIVIAADNGGGKTNFLLALGWCLFGSALPDSKEMLNREARRSLSIGESTESVVEVTLMVSDTEMAIIRRSKAFEKQLSDEVIGIGEDLIVTLRPINGSEVAQVVPDPHKWLERTLPSQYKGQVIFDGEELTKFFETDHKSSIRPYVENLAKLSSLETLMSKCETRKNSLRRKITQKGGKEAEDLEKELQSVLPRIDELQSDLEGLNDEYQQEKQQYDASTSLLEGESDLKALIEQEKGLLDQKAILENQIQQSRASMDSNLFSAGLSHSLLSLSEPSVSSMVKQGKDRGQYPADYDSDALKKLLSDHACICGQDLSPGSDGERRVRSIIEKSELAGEIGEAIKAVEGAVYKAQGKASAKFSSYRSDRNNFTNLKNGLKSLEEDLAKCRQRISSFKVDRGQIERIIFNRDLQRHKIEELWEKIAQKEIHLRDKKEKVERIQNSLQSLFEQKNERERLSLQAAFLERVLQQSKGLRVQILEMVRQQLEASVRDSYNKLKNGTYSVQVTEDFEVRALTVDGISQGQSQGESMILAYAFTSAVRKVLDLNLPLIIDYPFGRLGEDLRFITCDTILGLNEKLEQDFQVIMLLITETEFTQQIYEHMNPYRPQFFWMHPVDTSGKVKDKLSKIELGLPEYILEKSI